METNERALSFVMDHTMEYEFTLKFKLPASTASEEELIVRLGGSGCTDALIGLGLPGYVSFEFIRDAKSAMTALMSAIMDVKKGIPEAELVEAAPDFMGLTDIADVVGVTRQNMRKLFMNHSANFPAPVHGGSAMVWHLSPVLEFMTERHYEINRATREISYAAMQVNLSKEKKLLDEKTGDQLSRCLAA